MSDVTLAAANLLDRAADAIEVYGWGQRQYAGVYHKDMCVVGAVSYAEFGDPFEFSRLYRTDGYSRHLTMRMFVASLADSHPVLVAALRALSDDIVLDGNHVSDAYTPMVWNDGVAADAEEVIAKLRSVALRLRAQVKADVTEPLVPA